MAATVESRVCVKCKTAYRTKLKKDKRGPRDVRVCPNCQHDNTPQH